MRRVTRIIVFLAVALAVVKLPESRIGRGVLAVVAIIVGLALAVEWLAGAGQRRPPSGRDPGAPTADADTAGSEHQHP